TCGLTGATGGAIDVDARQANLTLTDTTKTATITGVAGRLDVVRPSGAVRADMRRTRISAWVARAVPLNLSTSDEQIGVTLADEAIAHASIEAFAENGDVLAHDVGMTATKTDQNSRLARIVGDAPRVSLRTSNGNIVFSRAQSR